jgi:hypothetical protein
MYLRSTKLGKREQKEVLYAVQAWEKARSKSATTGAAVLSLAASLATESAGLNALAAQLDAEMDDRASDNPEPGVRYVAESLRAMRARIRALANCLRAGEEA